MESLSSARTVTGGVTSPGGSYGTGGFGGLDASDSSSDGGTAAASPSPALPPSAGTAPVSGSDLKADFPAPSDAVATTPLESTLGAKAWTTNLDPRSVESFYRQALSARNYKLNHSSLQPDAPPGVSSAIYAVMDLANNQVGLISVSNDGDGTPTTIDWSPS